MNPIKVILDTDPGVDDAMALYFALAHPNIDLVGITTTFGNVSVEQAAANALYLTSIAGRSIPVAQGVQDPWVKPRESAPDFIHGADGLGNLPSRVKIHNKIESRSAAQFIVDMAREFPGQITLVAIAPLGNLSLALKIEPNLPKLLHEVVIMGGAIAEPGNVSPVAEANIWNDPHAADKVFSAGWKLTMLGLDVTHRVILPLALIRKIADKHQHVATNTLLHAVDFYSNFYGDLHPEVAAIHGCFAHDVLTFIYLTNPDFFKLEIGRIRVSTDGITQGLTAMSRRHINEYPQQGWEGHIPSTNVCMQVNARGCLDVFEETLLLDWLSV